MSAEASQGKQPFSKQSEQREAGQRWRVEAECAEGELLTNAEAQGVRLNTPPRQVIARGKFPKTECRSEAETDSSTCPAGKLLRHCGTNQKRGEQHDRPEPKTCPVCPLRESWTSSQTGRPVTRTCSEAEGERQREHAWTPEAVMGKVLRGLLAEGKFAQAVRHGLKKIRYVGQEMALRQRNLVAFLLNLNRSVRGMAEGMTL